ncbi:MAG: hypothetical protein LBI62_02585 [Candidatus Accumulibacter sp.]|jgi:Na+-transporting methylmalonyl-CoA/oxaloacetate decarboxylase gamma subunit|nr:hypothetical protein [Accumulibacter sp.]
MLSVAILKSLQVYGIAAVISILVAILIKLLVGVTGHIEKRARGAAPAPIVPHPAAPPAVAPPMPEEVVAAIAAAVATAIGPHRILHIGESSHSWTYEGRSALHSHQPKR